MRIDDRLLLIFASLRKRWLLGGDPGPCQERLLRRLVRGCANTAFGQEHGFSSLRSAKQYLQRIPPQNYDDLRPSIEAIRAGRRDVLFPGKPVCFASTTGTEGRAKLIPLNRPLLGSTRRAAVDAALFGGLSRGSMAWRRGKVLYIGPRKGKRQGEWMVYSEGTAYAYLQARPLTARFLPVYDALPVFGQPQDWAALAELARRNPITGVAGNPLEIAGFAQATGMVLPGVEIVFNCGFWVEDHLHIYREAFPNAEVVDHYGTNEGAFGLPVSPGTFLLNCRRIFFSFVPLEGGDEAVGLEDLEMGRKFRLLVTTPGGLWNYRTGDVVMPVSLRPPVVALCGRGSRILSLAGEAVTENEVVSAVRRAGLQSADYAVAQADRGYVLYLHEGSIDPVAVDGHLRRLNQAYDRLRQSGRIEVLRVCRATLGPDPAGKPVRIVVGRADFPKPKEATVP